MAIRRYPRPGQKISPEALAAVLEVPIPWRLSNPDQTGAELLSELDETTWERLSPNVCSKLGAAVVREISSRIASLPDSILAQKLPLPDAWGGEMNSAHLEQLPLEARTYNCLVAEGIVDAPQKLAGLTIRDLLKIRSFGAKSLVDLLVTLESMSRAVRRDSLADIPDLGPIRPKVTRYPRPGHPLAPACLAEILSFPIPTTVRKKFSLEATTLAELDASLWERLDTATLSKLGDLVVQQIDAQLPSLPPNILYMHLPMPEDGVGLQDLELERRTYNCLEREGYLEKPGRLFELTVGELLQYRGVGGKSLVDFLTSLEHCHPTTPDDQELSPDGHKIARTLEKDLSARVGDAFIGRDDPRFGGALRSVDPSSSQFGDVLEGIRQNRYSDVQLRAMKPGLADLAQGLEQAAGLTVRQEVEQVAVVGLSERNREIVGHYYGWLGDGPQTLKQIGERFGLTRERVRQIGVEQSQRLRTMRPHLPQLRTALQEIALRLPLEESELAPWLGVGSTGLSLRSLDQIARLFEIPLTFAIVEVDGRALALPGHEEADVEAVIALVGKQVDAWGLGSFAELEAQVRSQLKIEMGRDVLERVLENMSDFSWLGDGWFTVRGNKSRLDLQVRKMLTVRRDLSLQEVRGGIIRSLKRSDLSPPPRVLAQLIDSFPGISVEGDKVLGEPDFINVEVLSSTERTMIELVREHGPELGRERFESLCARRGIKRPTFQSRLDCSPALVLVESNRYALRGTRPVVAGQDGEIHIEADPTRELLRVSMILSPEILAHGRISLPSGHTFPLRGDFELRTSDELVHGVASVGTEILEGLSPLFARRGGEPGDGLTLEVSGRLGAVTAYFGESAFWRLATL